MRKDTDELWIPCHRRLRSELVKWLEGANLSGTILVNPDGEAWDSATFGVTWWQARERFLPDDDYTFHGLRKDASARLAGSAAAPSKS
jgi:hypothetical protein